MYFMGICIQVQKSVQIADHNNKFLNLYRTFFYDVENMYRLNILFGENIIKLINQKED